MGFGFLLIGYFLTFLMSNLHPIFAFAGAYLMLLALLKLRSYKRSFGNTIIPTLLLMVLSLFNTAKSLCQMFDIWNASFDGLFVFYFLDYIYAGAVIVFHITLLLAVSALAESTGLEKIRVMSLRNLIFFIVYVIAYAVAFFPLPLVALQYVRLMVSIMQLLWVILNLVLIWRCFQNMVDAEKDKKALEKELLKKAKREGK